MVNRSVRRAIEDRLEIHDIHAACSISSGLDHTRVTFRFGRRDMRMEDGRGKAIYLDLGIGAKRFIVDGRLRNLTPPDIFT